MEAKQKKQNKSSKEPATFSLISNIKNVIPKNLYKYKLWKIIMIGICIGISYGK